METPGGEALELTPQEQQLLRRFFRRHTLPYVVGLGAAGLLCAALALARGGPAHEAGNDPGLLRLRTELDAVRMDLETARGRLQRMERAAEETARSAEALHRRFDSALQRVDVLESGADETQKRVMDSVARLAAKPAAAPSADLDAMLERLDSVETRLFYLERGVAGGDPGGRSPPPAAPD
ncbi:MAG: hypothetical protein OEM05_02915 [Myxococcales bacterium]|nr:hypothetical protein [Myxococcales bacterium]